MLIINILYSFFIKININNTGNELKILNILYFYTYFHIKSLKIYLIFYEFHKDGIIFVNLFNKLILLCQNSS